MKTKVSKVKVGDNVRINNHPDLKKELHGKIGLITGCVAGIYPGQFDVIIEGRKYVLRGDQLTFVEIESGLI